MVVADSEKSIPKDITGLNFEDALKELENIVQKIESGDGGLDDAIRSYERGVALKQHCEAKLQEAQARVERVVLGADGDIDLEPSEID